MMAEKDKPDQLDDAEDDPAKKHLPFAEEKVHHCYPYHRTSIADLANQELFHALVNSDESDDDDGKSTVNSHQNPPAIPEVEKGHNVNVSERGNEEDGPQVVSGHNVNVSERGNKEDGPQEVSGHKTKTGTQAPSDKSEMSEDQDELEDDDNSDFSATTAVSGKDDESLGKASKVKQKRLTKRKGRKSPGEKEEEGQEDSSAKKPKRTPKTRKKQKVFLEKFLEPDFYSEVSDFDDEKDIVPPFCKVVDVEGDTDTAGKKMLILGPNSDTTGRFHGPEADLDRYGLVHPLNSTDLAMIHDPFLRYEDKVCVRPPGAVQIPGYDGYFYQVKYVVKDQVSYMDYRKLWCHETLMVKSNDAQRERGPRKPKGFEQQKGAPAFFAFPVGYMFFRNGKLYRNLKFCHHEQLYCASSVKPNGDAVDPDSFNFSAIYPEDVDDLTPAGSVLSDVWIKEEQKRKRKEKARRTERRLWPRISQDRNGNVAICSPMWPYEVRSLINRTEIHQVKREKEIRILAKSPSQTPTNATEDSDNQQIKKFKNLVKTPVGTQHDIGTDLVGEPGALQSEAGNIPESFLNDCGRDVDEFQKLVDQKAKLEQEVESLKAAIALKMTTEDLIESLKTSMPSTELLEELKNRLIAVEQKLANIPDIDEFKAITEGLKNVLGEVIPGLVLKLGSVAEHADNIQKTLDTAMIALENLQSQFVPAVVYSIGDSGAPPTGEAPKQTLMVTPPPPVVTLKTTESTDAVQNSLQDDAASVKEAAASVKEASPEPDQDSSDDNEEPVNPIYKFVGIRKDVDQFTLLIGLGKIENGKMIPGYNVEMPAELIDRLVSVLTDKIEPLLKQQKY